MLHIAICDDEEEALNELKYKIERILNNEVTISLHTNPFSLLTYIVDEVKGQIDLVILDIQLKEQNSIQAAETVLDYSNNIKIIVLVNKWVDDGISLYCQ